MFDGKVALVTGGSRGIGRATVLELAARGAQLAVVARNPSHLSTVQSDVRSTGGACLTYSADIANRAEMADVVADVVAQWGRLDVLVNNAAIDQGASSVLELSDADWHQVMETDLRGVFIPSQLAARVMAEQGAGSIVNVTSVTARRGGSHANYSAAKAGLLGLTRSMARELGPRGVRVNALAPGYIATELILGWPQERLAAFVNTTPLGRLGTPEEIAKAIAFLASDDASFITGATLDVNGGIWLGG